MGRQKAERDLHEAAQKVRFYCDFMSMTVDIYQGIQNQYISRMINNDGQVYNLNDHQYFLDTNTYFLFSKYLVCIGQPGVQSFR